MKKMKYFLLAIAVLNLASTSASAATIKIANNAASSSFEYIPIYPSGTLQANEYITTDTLTGPTEQTSVITANGGNGNGAASASVAAQTGLLKSSSSATYTSTIPNDTSYGGSASSQVWLSEGITITGSGVITAELSYDGFFDVSSNAEDGSPAFSAQGSLSLGGSSDIFGIGSVDYLSTVTNSIPSNIFDTVQGVLSVTINVSDGDFLTLESYLLTQILGGSNGMVDFSNTAALSIFASSGVSLAYADPRFLSVVSTPIAPVPLPASGLLLLTAFAGLSAMRRRKKPA